MTEMMRAATHHRFGTPDVIRVEEVPMPELVEDGLLVRIRATSVNPAEWYAVHGRPWIARTSMGLRHPKDALLGADFAGVVEAAGSQVTDFAVGDRVFGGRTGSWAEYVVVRMAVAHIPETVSFEEAAAVPIAGLTALQGLRDHGTLVAGQRVLINGGSGGVGTYAVQIARVLGAEVTAVVRSHNLEQTRSLGADRVFDYTTDDFTRSGDTYDLILDVAGGRPWSQLKRVLAPDGLVVVVGAPKGTRLLGPLSHIAGITIGSLLSPQQTKFFIAKFNRPDLEYLAELLESGRLRTVIDRRFHGLEEIPDAVRYLGEGHARSKVVVSI